MMEHLVGPVAGLFGGVVKGSAHVAKHASPLHTAQHIEEEFRGLIFVGIHPEKAGGVRGVVLMEESDGEGERITLLEAGDNEVQIPAHRTGALGVMCSVPIPGAVNWPGMLPLPSSSWACLNVAMLSGRLSGTQTGAFLRSAVSAVTVIGSLGFCAARGADNAVVSSTAMAINRLMVSISRKK